MLKVTCVHCQQGFDIQDQQMGTVVSCPHCGKQVTAGTPALGGIPTPHAPAGRGGGISTGLIVAMAVGGGLLAVVLIVALMFALTMPALSNARSSARMMQNSAQIKGLHQSMVMYAQGNRDWYPGLRSNGRVWTAEDDKPPYEVDADGTAPEVRFEILLLADYFEGDYLTSPGEALMAWQEGDSFDTSMYSFALLRLEVGDDGKLAAWQRHEEWTDTVDSQAVVISDRNITGDSDTDGNQASVQSLWTNAPGDWRGSVGWNDNHISLETSPLMENTQYGEGTLLVDDNLFQGGGGDASVTPDGQRSETGEDDADLDHASR